MSNPTAQTSTTPHKLTTLDSIRERYDLPAPHATTIISIPLPATVGNDRTVRISAREAELLHRGASPASIGHIDHVLGSLERSGHPLLVTANDDSAAYCWLGFDIEPHSTVGRLPSLLPALHQVALAGRSTIAVAVDRKGADLYRVGSFDITAIETVEGDDERIHKSAGGGWSHARQQRHSEVIWERNAALIAAAAGDAAARLGAQDVVLTGDDREVQLVEQLLDRTPALSISRGQAGGRHEPNAPARLRAEALAQRTASMREATSHALSELREELGQRDRAIDGSVHVMEAIAENRVKTIYADLDQTAHASPPGLDAALRAALSHGAAVTTGHGFGVADGIAATLRYPYT